MSTTVRRLRKQCTVFCVFMALFIAHAAVAVTSPIVNKNNTMQVPALVTGTDNVTDKYIGLLEKTNEQLALQWYPYQAIVGIVAICVGVLTLIVAICAVVVSYVLWRQGADYKKEKERQAKFYFDELNRESRMVLDDFKRNTDALEKKYQELKKLQPASGGSQLQDHQKYELLKEEVLKALAERNLLAHQIGGLSGNNIIFGQRNIPDSHPHMCSMCHKVYQVPGVPIGNMSSAGAKLGKVVICPQCLNADTI